MSVKDAPIEAITLSGVMKDLDTRGFSEHFAVENGELRGLDTGTTFAPDEISISERHRFEGISDPDDMAILYAIETDSGVRGTLTDAYGVYADPRIGDFVEQVIDPAA
jgi:hypothetical protein